MSAVAKLLEEAKAGGEKLRDVRAAARERAVRTIRKLEAALVDALGGDKLRGLPALGTAYDGGGKFFASRARATRSRSWSSAKTGAS